MSIFDACPRTGGDPIDWADLLDRFEWLRALDGAPQNPRFHAEGDVLIHTRLVVESLTALSDWQSLEPSDQENLFVAALLHDVAKPDCTRTELDGSLSSRGHARRGAIRAREILWRLDVAPPRREHIASLVRWHMLPHHLVERDHAAQDLIRAAESVTWRELALHAEADARGRICEDFDAGLERITLARELVESWNCLETPFPFANDHTRVLYLRGERVDPKSSAWFEPKCHVTLLSGFPGAGKDTWVRAHGGGRSVVSLDAWRTRLGIAPEGVQGRVIQAAREEAREHLRRGTDFIWNATSLSRQVRSQCLDLFLRYGAEVTIRYFEVGEKTLHERNRAREHSVPTAVLKRLCARWEVPDRGEAHSVVIESEVR